MKPYQRQMLIAAAILVALAAYPATSFATVTMILENNAFSGSNIPGGNIQLDFEQTDTDEITLTITNNVTGTGSFVDSVYINLDPDLVATTTVAYSSGQVGTPTAISANAYKADGDGKYDVRIDFPTPEGQRFTLGETSVYVFTGAGLTETSFNFLSAPDGGHGPFIVAAHVQGFGSSGWITSVPEPGSIGIWTILAMTGIVPAWMQRRRQAKHAT